MKIRTCASMTIDCSLNPPMTCVYVYVWYRFSLSTMWSYLKIFYPGYFRRPSTNVRTRLDQQTS